MEVANKYLFHWTIPKLWIFKKYFNNHQESDMKTPSRILKPQSWMSFWKLLLCISYYINWIFFKIEILLIGCFDLYFNTKCMSSHTLKYGRVILFLVVWVFLIVRLSVW